MKNSNANFSLIAVSCEVIFQLVDWAHLSGGKLVCGCFDKDRQC